MRRRFFVPQFSGGTACIEGETAHHLARVLRAEPGQLYELSDGQHLCLARVQRVTRDRVDFTVVEPIEARLPRVEATLLIAVVKFERFEWALEKATELGAGTIVPLAAARSEKALHRGCAQARRPLGEDTFRIRAAGPLSAPATTAPAGAGRAKRSRPMKAPIRILLSERAERSAAKSGAGMPRRPRPPCSVRLRCESRSPSAPRVAGPTKNSPPLKRRGSLPPPSAPIFCAPKRRWSRRSPPRTCTSIDSQRKSTAVARWPETRGVI